jgi:class 3 adenylate cyclase
MARPPVHYATTADGLQIAYQVLGDGAVDVVIVPGVVSNVDLNRDYPFYGDYVRRFPRFARTITLDKRGAGVSDREVGSGTAEDRIDDVRAVMDAVGCRRVALLGQGDGGFIAIVFAATHPERVSALVLVEPFARWTAAPDYREGADEEAIEAVRRRYVTTWGTGRALLLTTTDASDEEAAREALALLERSVGTPHSVSRYLEGVLALDVRSALPLIEAPTLVIHRAGHPFFAGPPVRYVADHIRGARYVEVTGGVGSWDAAKQDAVIDLIEEFLTGQRPPAPDADRVLATVLFTDIADSTRHAAALGDRRWRGVLDAHDARSAAEVERFRGRVVKRTGDGMLATFDGPARAVRCAHAIVEGARGLGIELRAGLHVGEVETRGADVSGLAVHIGARIAALARPSEVLASATVRDLVAGSGLEFDDRGEHELKGVHGRWRLLAVRPPR